MVCPFNSPRSNVCMAFFASEARSKVTYATPRSTSHFRTRPRSPNASLISRRSRSKGTFVTLMRTPSDLVAAAARTGAASSTTRRPETRSRSPIRSQPSPAAARRGASRRGASRRRGRAPRTRPAGPKSDMPILRAVRGGSSHSGRMRFIGGIISRSSSKKEGLEGPPKPQSSSAPKRRPPLLRPLPKKPLRKPLPLPLGMPGGARVQGAVKSNLS
mmetsp:Transcript_21121/g.31597  ORF Transcript_21121/g.31597 Transcript_21121/m.31597 type:complete len:216 (-) Transcript_21121:660-1307(-)